jgi:hypothetical protein
MSRRGWIELGNEPDEDVGELYPYSAPALGYLSLLGKVGGLLPGDGSMRVCYDIQTGRGPCC